MTVHHRNFGIPRRDLLDVPDWPMEAARPGLWQSWSEFRRAILVALLGWIGVGVIVVVILFAAEILSW